MAQYTPMMANYLETKQQYKDCILFYRLGDFYEMFFEDAILTSRELGLTLTGKDCGMEERAPMCGIPFHAADSYLNKLVEKGYKVAVCEQVEDPKQAKGLVKREVIRIVTPGTNLDPQALDEGRNNYVMCAMPSGDQFLLALADITTGVFIAGDVPSYDHLLDEIARYQPAELIVSVHSENLLSRKDDLKERFGTCLFSLADRCFDEQVCRETLLDHFHISTLSQLPLEERTGSWRCAGALLVYLKENQMQDLSSLTQLMPYVYARYMVLDSSTRRNLELTETMREKKKRGSLLWVLDKTKTAMGARMLRSFLDQPLLDKTEITARQKAVGELKDNAFVREELREYLNQVYDMERLISKISYNTANPRDLIAFSSSLLLIPPIKEILRSMESPLICQLRDQLDSLEDVADLIGRSIVEDPPISLREGGFIKEGFNEEADRLRRAKTDGKAWLGSIEAKERESTGIRNLKIKYNKVFGYYLEVTNSFKDKVPDYYIRKQTLTNAERYITPELKELESTILGAEEHLNALEYELFTQVRLQTAEQLARVQRTAGALAMLDALSCLAFVAEQNNYICPTITRTGGIDIRDGRHPVVEQMSKGDLFIPNDTMLDNQSRRIAIITGPNMAGKSTYMRQTALIVLMAQIGSFVPASSARIGIVDRIFTRVGASDDLASGQSTFMVEMNEVANILKHATKNSLLILDEIGRGTSTFDGLSIAWAVVEHIADPEKIGAKTLFATHYHELTELEGKIPCVTNYCIAVREKGEGIVFLRKIIPGGADKSYGVQVARLAGLPEEVLHRANQLLAELSENDITAKPAVIRESFKKHKSPEKKKEQEASSQLSFMVPPQDAEVLRELEMLDVTTLSPIEAMNTLYQLQGRLSARNHQ